MVCKKMIAIRISNIFVEHLQYESQTFDIGFTVKYLQYAKQLWFLRHMMNFLNSYMLS